MDMTNESVFYEFQNDELLGIDGGVSWNDVGLFIAGAAGTAIGGAAGAKWGAAVGSVGGPGGAIIGGIVGGAAGIILYTLWD